MENLTTYYLQVIFISFIVINHLAEIYLSRRQLQALQDHRTTVPPEFTHVITLGDHQKAIEYSSARLKLGQLHLVWDVILLFAWFPLRGLEKLYLAVPFTGTHKEVAFLLTFTVIQMFLNLPWSLYSTFVLEERFGFNRTTPSLYLKDRLKGLVLGAGIGIPLLYLILKIYELAGTSWWLLSFLLLTGFQFLLVWIYPRWIAPLFNKFQPLEGEELKTGIERLVTSAGFQAKEIFVMDASKRSSHGNAYFTGLGKTKRVVFFDTLLKDLLVNEILAILAHELGHMKLKHIPKSMITSVVLSFVGFWVMGQLSHVSWFYQGHFLRVLSPGALFLIFTQAIPLYTFWVSPVSAWISRRREFEADAYAAEENDPENLISGLLKLYQQNASPVVSDRLYSGFYNSHPPAIERIKRLRSLKRQPG